MNVARSRRLAFILCIFFGATTASAVAALSAENETDAWLRYAPQDVKSIKKFAALPWHVEALDDSLVLNSARKELIKGMRRMIGRNLDPQPGRKDVFILGTRRDVHKKIPELKLPNLAGEGYWLKAVRLRGRESLVIAGGTDRGGWRDTICNWIHQLSGIPDPQGRVGTEPRP